MFTCENEFLHLELNPQAPAWSLTSRGQKGFHLHNVKLRLDFRRGSKSFTALERWQHVAEQQAQPPPELPVAYSLAVSIGPDPFGLRYRLQFILPALPQPCLLWNLAVENLSGEPIFIERLDLLRLGLDKGSALRADWLAPAFFSNGWGSWNHSGAYGLADRFRRTHLGPLTEPMRINAGTPHPKQTGHFSADMFGVLGDRVRRSGLLAGFLSQKQHFGSLVTELSPAGATLHMWANGDNARLDPGAAIATDWAVLFPVDLDAADPLGPYLKMVARHHGLPVEPDANLPVANLPVGWCSWYHYYSQISAADVIENLEAAQNLKPRLPLKLLQIDDGFEAQVGDWFEFNERFPDGVAPLAGAISAAGFEPGLWLAPFIVHPRSRLYQERPEWLLRGRFNRPVNAGLSFRDALCTALDLTQPEALAYAADVISIAVHRWGFPYLKLDFLYAAALPGRRSDPTRTRAQTLRQGLEALRKAAGPETTLVGCGCPLGPAIGLVDIMRIGADVSGEWFPTYAGSKFFVQSEPDYPAARNAIQNSLTRAALHRRWWINDPDCLLVRERQTLTRSEVQSLATVVALSGGAFTLSERLELLTEAQIRLAAGLVPPLDRRPQIPDLFDHTTPERLRLDLNNQTGDWHLVALFNWRDEKRDLTLQLADFGLADTAAGWVHEYWSGQNRPLVNGATTFLDVPSHGVILCSLRQIPTSQPVYIGSDLHISQGLEVESWENSPGCLAFELARPGLSCGEITLALPDPPQAAFLDDQPLDWRPSGAGLYRFMVTVNRSARLRIHYGREKNEQF